MNQNKNWYDDVQEVPTSYRHLIELPAYAAMLQLMNSYFEDKGETILRYQDGFLVVKDDEGREMKYGLDNLVRQISSAEQTDYESVVYSHFNKVNYSDSAYSFFFRDYEHARAHLKLVIKHQEVFNEEQMVAFVWMSHFPGLVSILVFDYDNQLRYLRREDIVEWGKPVEVLFDEALSNISQEDVLVSTLTHPDGYRFYSFVHGDFASVRLINLDQNAPFAVGSYGSLVLVPTKGASFASPIDDDRVIDRIQVIAPLGVELYQKEPGNITTDFFWYYQGAYALFPSTVVGDGAVRVRLPEKLEELLKSSQC